ALVGTELVEVVVAGDLFPAVLLLVGAEGALPDIGERRLRQRRVIQAAARDQTRRRDGRCANEVPAAEVVRFRRDFRVRKRRVRAKQQRPTPPLALDAPSLPTVAAIRIILWPMPQTGRRFCPLRSTSSARPSRSWPGTCACCRPIASARCQTHSAASSRRPRRAARSCRR